MTVSTSYSPKVYSGNGSTTVFPVTWPFDDDADLVVTHTAADGTQTVWTQDGEGSDGYTLEETDTGSGVYQVTANTAPASETTLTLSRATPITQEYDPQNGRQYQADVLESALDRMVMQNQESSHAASLQTADNVETAISISSADNVETASTVYQSGGTVTNATTVNEFSGTVDYLDIETISGVETDFYVSSYGDPTAVQHFRRAGGTKNVPTALTSGNLAMGIGCRPYTGTGWTEHSTAAIHAILTETCSGTNQGTKLCLVATPQGATYEGRVTVITIDADGSAGLIESDFSSADFSTRTRFKTTEANSQTSISAVPDGTSTISSWNVHNAEDPSNAGFTQLRIDDDVAEIRIGQRGTGTEPTKFRIINDSESTIIEFDFSAGEVLVNGAKLRFGADSNAPLDLAGSGSPESSVAAPIGSIYRRTDGGANTTLYVKESGTGNTGWVAK